MEDNEQNLKPQPTGGLKLMTVFIAVLALHVVVIGGFTVWHLLNPATSDADLALDKAHKGKIVTDSTIGEGSASDVASIDKATADNPTAPTSGTDAASDNITTTTPAAIAAPAPAPATASVATPAPVPTPITAPGVQPPPAMSEDTTVTTVTTPAASTPSGPIHHGPVVTPPDNLAPPADNTTVATTTPAPAPAVAEAPVPSTEGTPYTVKKGDSLAKIAKRHHVVLNNLRLANGLTNDSLHIGQKLTIPSRNKTPDEMAATAPAPAPTPAPSMAAAPTTTPTESADVTEAPDASSIAAAAPEPATTRTHEPRLATTATPRHHKTTASHHLYTVVKGDTLTKIAKRYHTTTSALIAANGIANAGRLSIGQKLHIPAHEHESRAAAAAAQEAAPAEETAPRTSAKGQLANYVQ